jgi:hypothetical protein
MQFPQTHYPPSVSETRVSGLWLLLVLSLFAILALSLFACFLYSSCRPEENKARKAGKIESQLKTVQRWASDF